MYLLFGIQYQAADFFIVPPGSAAFSRIATLAPRLDALSAAGKPAAPAPTTTTSYVSSQTTSLASTTLRLGSIASPPLVTYMSRVQSAAQRWTATSSDCL